MKNVDGNGNGSYSMARSQRIIPIACDRAWTILTTIEQWPQWNDALYEVKPDRMDFQYRFRLRGLGWATCEMRVNDSRHDLYYLLRVKGNVECGVMHLQERSEQETDMNYQITLHGWLHRLLPLQNMAQWRMERFTRYCQHVVSR